MKTAAHANPCRATVTGATLALAALNILPCRLAAQDTRPTPAPTETAPARFEATIYEVRVPEDRIASLDARSLEAKAGTAQSLTKALAEFGQTKVRYKVDQTVNLFRDRITLADNEPMATGPRTQKVGLIIELSASAPASDGKRKVPNTLVVLCLKEPDDGSFELPPGVGIKPVRIISLRHSEVPRFGQPCVQLNVSAGTSEPAAQATAYVVRYVFSETWP
jgi:hypothetical protein